MADGSRDARTARISGEEALAVHAMAPAGKLATRLTIAVLAVLGLTIGSAAAAPVLTMAAAGEGLTLSVDQGQPPSGQLDIDIDTRSDTGAWYTSPIWIAIGVVALLVIIALIVTATRGGGATIVKE